MTNTTILPTPVTCKFRGCLWIGVSIIALFKSAAVKFGVIYIPCAVVSQVRTLQLQVHVHVHKVLSIANLLGQTMYSVFGSERLVYIIAPFKRYTLASL